MKPRLPIAELLLSALCLWAAWYHTPAGALIRTAGAWFFKAHTDARPLLAYYGAGTLVPPPLHGPPLAGPVPPAEALGYGAAAVQPSLGPPRAVAARLDALAASLGSPDAAALALFCGEEETRYAVEQSGSHALVDLARELPPRSQACITRAAQALMLGEAYVLAWPLPEAVRITSPFGMREHPLLGGLRMHNGVDLGAAPGTPVRAVADGVVRRASSDEVNGRIVVIDHGHGVLTSYCHNDQLLVKREARVHRGEIIARSGSTGRSTGPHLHYQLDLAGEPADPLRFRVQRPKTSIGASD